MSSQPPPPVDLRRPQGIAAHVRQIPALLIAHLRGFPPAYRMLLTVEVFTGDRIGAAGRTPLHVLAWHDLLNYRQATSCFKGLITHAALPGQLYGLAGLYFTDPVSLKALAIPYLKRQDPVLTIVTCMTGHVPACAIVERIVDGAWPEELRRGGQGIMPRWSRPSKTYTHHDDTPRASGAA